MKYYFSREILFTHHFPRNARWYQKLGGILGVPGDSGSFGGSRETQGSLESLGFPWSWGLWFGSHLFAIPLISRTSFISFIVRSKHKKINKKSSFLLKIIYLHNLWYLASMKTLNIRRKIILALSFHEKMIFLEGPLY